MSTKTKENLRQALAGESQAYFRYLGFAEKADQDGFPGVAHALSHQKALGVFPDTKANLEAAIQGETHEFKTMYPAMIKKAVEEQEIEARHSLEYAMSM